MGRQPRHSPAELQVEIDTFSALGAAQTMSYTCMHGYFCAALPPIANNDVVKIGQQLRNTTVETPVADGILSLVEP